jgi:hypothetical protein
LKKYTKTNFYKHTFCEFVEVVPIDGTPLDWQYKSKSGSYYHFTNEGVYRYANHWGRAANCRWRLISSSSLKSNNSQNRMGYAKWTDFYPNNETEKLFYVEVHFETNEVVFQHKNNPNFMSNAVLRNASETAKVIRQIKDVLTSNQWAKYLHLEAIESARRFVIDQLVTTELSLHEIKKKLLTKE